VRLFHTYLRKLTHVCAHIHTLGVAPTGVVTLTALSSSVPAREIRVGWTLPTAGYAVDNEIISFVKFTHTPFPTPVGAATTTTLAIASTAVTSFVFRNLCQVSVTHSIYHLLLCFLRLHNNFCFTLARTHAHTCTHTYTHIQEGLSLTAQACNAYGCGGASSSLTRHTMLSAPDGPTNVTVTAVANEFNSLDVRWRWPTQRCDNGYTMSGKGAFGL
jgi:hypothetical protein